MLLPSALPCDLFAASTQRPQRPQRPQLQSFSPFSPSAKVAQSTAGSILASCRALQAILGGPAQAPENVGSPTTMRPALSQLDAPALNSPCRTAQPPRGLNKRSRNEFEDDEDTTKSTTHTIPDYRNQYQTPKRQRRTPLDLPAGLLASDFEALSTPHPSCRTPDCDVDIEMPPAPSTRPPQTSQSSLTSPPTLSFSAASSTSQTQSSVEEESSREWWSPTDDRRLVEAVLSKLNLSKRDWNDCAKQLGKDQDSLGRRWKLLVGEGNVGIRRGTGRIHVRTDLDIRSW